MLQSTLHYHSTIRRHLMYTYNHVNINIMLLLPQQILSYMNTLVIMNSSTNTHLPPLQCMVNTSFYDYATGDIITLHCVVYTNGQV